MLSIPFIHCNSLPMRYSNNSYHLWSLLNGAWLSQELRTKVSNLNLAPLRFCQFQNLSEHEVKLNHSACSRPLSQIFGTQIESILQRRVTIVRSVSTMLYVGLSGKRNQTIRWVLIHSRQKGQYRRIRVATSTVWWRHICDNNACQVEKTGRL